MDHADKARGTDAWAEFSLVSSRTVLNLGKEKEREREKRERETERQRDREREKERERKKERERERQRERERERQRQRERVKESERKRHTHREKANMAILWPPTFSEQMHFSLTDAIFFQPAMKLGMRGLESLCKIARLHYHFYLSNLPPHPHPPFVLYLHVEQVHVHSAARGQRLNVQIYSSGKITSLLTPTTMYYLQGHKLAQLQMYMYMQM